MATNRGFSYQVDGLKELVRDLKTEPERLDQELRKRFKEVAEDEARQFAVWDCVTNAVYDHKAAAAEPPPAPIPQPEQQP